MRKSIRQIHQQNLSVKLVHILPVTTVQPASSFLGKLAKFAKFSIFWKMLHSFCREELLRSRCAGTKDVATVARQTRLMLNICLNTQIQKFKRHKFRNTQIQRMWSLAVKLGRLRNSQKLKCLRVLQSSDIVLFLRHLFLPLPPPQLGLCPAYLRMPKNTLE